MCKKTGKIAVCILLLCALFTASFTAGAVTPDDPFQIVDAERVDGRTMIIRFNKKAVLDATKLFSWFGHDKGVSEDTGYVCINMDYGTSDNVLVEDDTALKMTFDEGIVDEFFNKEGKEGKFYIVFHQDYNGALSSENFETLVYEPVDLYQQNVFAGVLGHSMYIPLADFEGSRWKDRVEVESGSGTTTPAATEPPAVSSDTKRSTDEPAKTDAATGEPTGTKQDVPAEKNFPVWIPVIAAAVVVAVIAVVVVVKKKTK